ncbi:MAG: hypothetical protein U0670_17095 [Anaerolineae bacterium]
MNLQNVIDNNTLVILGICGFLTVCFGLLVLGFTTIFRFTGRNFMGFLSMLVRNQKAVDEKDSLVGTVKKPNLRRIADEDDFNAALAKHLVTDPTTGQPPAQGQVISSSPAAQAASTPYNAPLTGAPKTPTVMPGYLPGTGQAINPPPAAPRTPAPRPAAPSQNTPPPQAPSDFGWENPSLRTPNLQDRRREEQERDEEDNLLGGLMP